MSVLDIRKIRIDLGLNQDEFANIIGFSKSAVQKWESGERNPDEKTIQIIKKNTQKHTCASFYNPKNDDYNDNIKDRITQGEQIKELLKRLEVAQEQINKLLAQQEKLIDKLK